MAFKYEIRYEWIEEYTAKYNKDKEEAEKVIKDCKRAIETLKEIGEEPPQKLLDKIQCAAKKIIFLEDAISSVKSHGTGPMRIDKRRNSKYNAQAKEKSTLTFPWLTEKTAANYKSGKCPINSLQQILLAMLRQQLKHGNGIEWLMSVDQMVETWPAIFTVVFDHANMSQACNRGQQAGVIMVQHRKGTPVWKFTDEAFNRIKSLIK